MAETTGGSDEDWDLARRFAAGEADSVRCSPWRSARWANRHLADEAMQETFQKAWRVRATFEPNRPLSPWLYMLAAVGADPHPPGGVGATAHR